MAYFEKTNISNIAGETVNPATSEQIAELLFSIKNLIIALQSPRGYDMSLQRQRGTNIIESGTITTVGTVTTATTVGTVNNIAAIGGAQGQILSNSANLDAWSSCVRARIT